MCEAQEPIHNKPRRVPQDWVAGGNEGWAHCWMGSSEACWYMLFPNLRHSQSKCTAEGCTVPCCAVVWCVLQGVSGQVKQRMLLTQQHPEMELRPMLLFPEVRP